jgi:hypothetical protein
MSGRERRGGWTSYDKERKSHTNESSSLLLAQQFSFISYSYRAGVV